MMDTKRIFGIFFTLVGTFAIIIGAIGLLNGGTVILSMQLSVIGSLVPAVIGLTFFIYGMKLIQSINTPN